MDKSLRNALIIGIIMIALSVGYYMIYRPIQKQNVMKKCNEDVEKMVGWDSRNKVKIEKFKEEYDRCLRQKGL